MLLHPELPSCEDCQQWMYSDKWRRVKRQGLQVLRPPGTPTPCYRCPKIPPDAKPCPANAVELSEKNHRAYDLYLQIKAGRPMPSDAIVWRNCGLLRQLEDSIQLMFLRMGQMVRGKDDGRT